MRILLFTLALALTCPALADEYRDRDGSLQSVIKPPAKYLNNVRIGDVDIQFLPRASVFAACETATGKAEQLGCTQELDSTCSVIVATDLPDDLRQAVLEHELAHCGPDVWPADHPLN